MVKAEWGTKRICPQCGTRYYDMKKNPPVCPNCGTAFDPDSQTRSRRSRAAPEDKGRKAAPTPESLDDLPNVPDEEVDDDAIIEDADELEDDVDVEDVVEVSTDDEERP